VRAWVVHHPGPVANTADALARVERAEPEPGPNEIRVKVSVCGICRTDLHLTEGDLPPRRADVIPGHEVVGAVETVGAGATRFAVGDRVGIAWLRHTCGTCRFCTRGDENLCVAPRFTGWDDDGGFAEYAVVHEDFAYRLPEEFTDERVAPLLCSGIIGYRALRRAQPEPGRRLGIYGFGASAHLAAQIALAAGSEVHVFTRSVAAQQLARDLGCTSVAGAADPAPVPLDGAILFAPVGDLVPVALRALDRGGRLAIAGIHLTDVPVLGYDDTLFNEKILTSTTANTRRDGEDLLELAARIPLRVEAVPYAFDDADRALRDIAADQVTGAAVLQI
jgi:alcohol dehydrogenase, propanol-preferring